MSTPIEYSRVVQELDTVIDVAAARTQMATVRAAIEALCVESEQVRRSSRVLPGVEPMVYVSDLRALLADDGAALREVKAAAYDEALAIIGLRHPGRVRRWQLMMRRFVLVRDEDVTGVSGTGKVAEGVLWSDGTVTVKWLGRRTSEVSWPGGVDDVEAVHGHNGATRVVWVDEDYTAARDGLHTVAYPDGSQVHCYCDLNTDHQAAFERPLEAVAAATEVSEA